MKKNRDFKTYITLLCAKNLISMQYEKELAYKSLEEVPLLYGSDSLYKINRKSAEFDLDFYKQSQKTLIKIEENNLEVIEKENFEIELKYDMSAFNGGVPLSKLIALKETLGATEIYCSGTGDTYDLSEQTSDHTDEVIIRVELHGNKSELVADYKTWLENLDKNKKLKM